jgi:hypothetical protein
MSTTLPIHNVDPLEDHPSGPSESLDGHIFGLAERLKSNKTAPGPDLDAEAEFPDELFRLPIPNEVFSRTDELSGPAVRILLVLIHEAYSYHPLRGWESSPRYLSSTEIRKATRSGLAMSPATFARAARELDAARLVRLRGGGTQGRALELRLYLDAPERRFTWIPAALIKAHGFFSHSALLVLLQVYAETWGSAHTTDEGGTVHPVWARLTNAELADAVGLKVATVRSAVEELMETGALERDRRSRGYAWSYRPSPPDVSHSFFNNTGGSHNRELCDPNNRERAHPRTRGGSRHRSRRGYAHSWDELRESAATGGGSQGQSPGGPVPEEGVPDSFGDTERGLYDVLTSESGFDLPRGWTIRMLRGREAQVVRKTLRVYQKRAETGEIHNPAGWIRAALENNWFAPTQAEKQGGGSRSRAEATSTTPLGRIFAKLAESAGFPSLEEATGAEEEAPPDPGGGRVASGRNRSGHPGHPTNPAHPGEPERKDHRRPAHSDPPCKADVEEAVGVTHSKMCDLVEALGRPKVGTWNCHQREGELNLFVPSRELAEWARSRKGPEASDRFQKAASTVVALYTDSCTTQG